MVNENSQGWYGGRRGPNFRGDMVPLLTMSGGSGFSFLHWLS